MELFLVEAPGIPADSIISVRAGATRRQAPLSQVDDTPFRFPCKLEDCGAIKIDVLSTVGSGRVICRPEQREYALRLDAPASGGREAAAGEDASSRGSVSFRVQPAANADRSEAEAVKKQHLKCEVDKYLEDHHILSFLQAILQGLMKDRPVDPYDYMARQFDAPKQGVYTGYQGTLGSEEGAAKTTLRPEEVQRGGYDLQPPAPRSTAGSEVASAADGRSGEAEARAAARKMAAALRRWRPLPPGAVAAPRAEGPSAAAGGVREADLSQLRKNARGVLVRGALDGRLVGAVSDVAAPRKEVRWGDEAPDAALRRRAGSLLCSAARSGELSGALRRASSEGEESEKLRCRLGALLAESAASGELKNAIGSAKSERADISDEEDILNSRNVIDPSNLNDTLTLASIKEKRGHQASATIDPSQIRESLAPVQQAARGVLMHGAANGGLAAALEEEQKSMAPRTIDPSKIRDSMAHGALRPALPESPKAGSTKTIDPSKIRDSMAHGALKAALPESPKAGSTKTIDPSKIRDSMAHGALKAALAESPKAGSTKTIDPSKIRDSMAHGALKAALAESPKAGASRTIDPFKMPDPRESNAPLEEAQEPKASETIDPRPRDAVTPEHKVARRGLVKASTSGNLGSMLAEEDKNLKQANQKHVSFNLARTPTPTQGSEAGDAFDAQGNALILNLAMDKAMLMTEIHKMQALIDQATAKKARMEADQSEKQGMLVRNRSAPL